MTKVALITGGSAGIGRATARAFAGLGYRLAIASRTEDPLKQVAIDLEKQLNAEILAVPTDVTDPSQVQKLVDATLERYEAIDILVNNAGICISGSFTSTTRADWEQVMNVNLWGYINTLQAIVPPMLDRGSGQIINVGSFGGKMPLPEMVAYCTTKYAVTGLTESLRLELEPKGISVIGVHPGVVKTDFLDRAIFTGDRATPPSAEAHLEDVEAESVEPGSAAAPTSEEPRQPSGEQRQQMEQTLNSFIAQTPEEIADAIVDASLAGKSDDIVVGLAQVATSAYQFLPGPIAALLKNAAGR
ncbi:MAG: SDR family oxidoreductase [Cyanobacteria bacterium J06639_1]